MKRVVLTSLVIGVILVLCGCGGGSAGTGGQFYQGNVVDRAGEALPGYTVTLLSTGDSAVSDQSGAFAIETSEDLSGKVDFLIEDGEVSVRTSISDVPLDAERVECVFEIDREGNTGSTRDVRIKKKEQGSGSSSSSRGSSSSSQGSSGSSSSSRGGSSSSVGSSSSDDSESSSSIDSSSSSDSDSASSSSSEQGESSSSDDSSASSSSSSTSGHGSSSSSSSNGGHGADD